MVDVVRVFFGGRGHPATFCSPRIAQQGLLDWAVLPCTVDTALLVAVAEFGDLRSFAALFSASRRWPWSLARSMRCLREWVEEKDLRSGGASCWCCGGLGLTRGFVARCHWCERVTCQDCVVAAAVDGLRAPPSWLCVSCGDEDLDTVGSLKMWFVDEAFDKIRCIDWDYDFPFFARLVYFSSGDAIGDERRVPLSLVNSSWGRAFRFVWDDVRRKTGWRLTHMVFGLVAVDETSKDRWRWSHFLSRSQASGCTEESPFELRVILKDFE